MQTIKNEVSCSSSRWARKAESIWRVWPVQDCSGLKASFELVCSKGSKNWEVSIKIGTSVLIVSVSEASSVHCTPTTLQKAETVGTIIKCILKQAWVSYIPVLIAVNETIRIMIFMSQLNLCSETLDMLCVYFCVDLLKTIYTAFCRGSRFLRAYEYAVVYIASP